jgi:hypothetical protein
MSILGRITRILMIGAGLFIAVAEVSQAAQWSAPLKDGGTVTVDPQTNRATVRRDGVETQLWDGVHRLEDGSTLTIRSISCAPVKCRRNRRPQKPVNGRERQLSVIHPANGWCVGSAVSIRPAAVWRPAILHGNC